MTEPLRRRVPILLPVLGLGDIPLRVSVWLVQAGADVAAGDSVVEICAGDVVVEIAAPVSGKVAGRLAAEDETISPTEPLGWIESDVPHSQR